MIQNIIYIVLALMGLGLLVFIHELAHYFMAKKVGMRIETFSIGFGKAIYSWKRKKVEWRIGILPFGGYVKIAGMQTEKNKDPYKIKDGFFGKKPMDRIKVAVVGPLVNIIFAFIVFTAIWLSGGREKAFSEYTHRIGWVDKTSKLYSKGVRPGDEILKYDGKDFRGFKDLIYSSVLDHSSFNIEGYKIGYFRDSKTFFNYEMQTYEDNSYGLKGMSTIGIIFPAGYLIYEPLVNDDGLTENSPILNSGIKPKDRIIWADGELIFSNQQLISLVNTPLSFVTIKRGDTVFHTKIPRVQIQDLQLSSFDKEEINDWKHETKIKDSLDNLYFLPYYFNENGVIEERLGFVEEQTEKKVFSINGRSFFYENLKRGDTIIAVNGKRVNSSFDILKNLQQREVTIIVQRNPKLLDNNISWKDADKDFDKWNQIKELKSIISAIGTDTVVKNANDLHLLDTIVPKTLSEMAEKSPEYQKNFDLIKRKIEGMDNSEKKHAALKQFEESQKKLLLGISLHDRSVVYNPNPFSLFSTVMKDTYRTFSSLITGHLNPKWLSGPVGIVQVVHHGWTLGIREALFWLGLISLNLGIINLFPIPALDGGHIVFSFVEMIRKKPISIKTMEKLIIPFIVLLIIFFIYVTYHDLARLFSRFFN
jgi:regulator of sigma E protease